MTGDPGHQGQRGQSADPRTVLFVMPSLAYLRFFQSALELLVDRGVNVRLLMQHRHGSTARARRMDRTDDASQWLERLRAIPNFACDVVDHFDDRRSSRLERLRRGTEFVRFDDPAFRTWTYMYEKRRRDAPAAVRRLVGWPLIRSSKGLRLLTRLLSTLERVLPAPKQPRAYVAGLQPDVLALCDSTSRGSLLSEYAKAAKEQGIAVAECVASWDNLTSRQRLRVIPDKLVVWNEKQVEEAETFHGVPRDRVAVCGAPGFDKWFSWEPRDRGDFLDRLGLDPTKPVILWVGGALYPSRRTEADYAESWVGALRGSDDSNLRDAGVILRPHPYRADEWRGLDVTRLGNAVVWPREAGMPVAQEQQADFYDSIYHSEAVLGLNTSAMIEAAIVGRPVLTILEPEFRSAQLDTFHFQYLLESSGGAVRATTSVEESLAELAVILLHHAEAASEQAQRFVIDFVRPYGLEQPATPMVVDTLERLAETSASRERDPVWVIVARGTLVVLEPLVVAAYDAYRSVHEWTSATFRTTATRIKHGWKHVRRFVVVRLRAAVRSRVRGARSRPSVPTADKRPPSTTRP